MLKRLWVLLLICGPAFSQQTPCSYVLGFNGVPDGQDSNSNQDGDQITSFSEGQLIDTLWMQSDGSNTLNGIIAICTDVTNIPTAIVVSASIVPPVSSGWSSVRISPITLNGTYWIIGQWQDGHGVGYTATVGGTWGRVSATPPSMISPPILSWSVSTGYQFAMFADYCGPTATPTPTGTLTPTNTPTKTPTPNQTPCATWVGVQTAPTPGREESIAGNWLDGNEWSTATTVLADGINVWIGPTGPINPATGGLTCGGGQFPVTVCAGIYNWNFDVSTPAYLLVGGGPVMTCAMNSFVFVPFENKTTIQPGNYFLGCQVPYNTNSAVASSYFAIWPFSSANQWIYESTYLGAPYPTANLSVDSNAQLFSNNVDTCSAVPTPIPTPSSSGPGHGLLLFGVGR